MSGIEMKSFDQADEVRQFKGKGHAEVVMIGDRPVIRSVFEPGWRWTTNLKPIAGTDLCQTTHFGYALQGRMRIHMADGTTTDITPGCVISIPPGHDAEVLGDESCVFVDFGDVASYARQT